MSLPSEVLPGRTYMVTRRCSERCFFLCPAHETNNAFIYCLALAAARTGVQHEFVAKSQNALRGRFENFWSSEQTSVVRLVEPNDVIDKMLYALTNPVKDPLVDHVWEV